MLGGSLFTAGCKPQDTNDTNSGAQKSTTDKLFTPGAYTASSTGRNGIVKLEVVLSENEITGIEVIESSETKVIGDAAIDIIPQRIIDYQTLNIDTVSGATYTSGAILFAVKDAITQAGGDPQSLPGTYSADASVADDEADVVIVGSGGAGLLAAITAHDQGKKVILIEKQGFLGAGDTVLISTGITGGGSEKLAEKGVDQYSTEEFYQHLEAQAVKKNIPVNKDNLKAYADKSGAVIDYLVDIGVPLTKYDKERLMYLTEDGSSPGTHIAKALAGEINDRSIDYRLDTKALSLINEGASITGVKVETAAGQYTIKAKSVILGTGGFSNNEKLLTEFNPAWVGRPTTGAISLTGDGHIMARDAGISLVCMDQVKANYLCHVLPTGDGASLTAIAPYCVIVNHQGKRFMNESDPSITHKSELMMTQDKQEGYAVIDQAVLDKLDLIKGYNDVGYFESGDTFDELAAKLEVDSKTFTQSMTSFKENTQAGSDPEFNRTINSTLSDPKYYASLVTPSMQSTYGGILVDASGRALSAKSDSLVTGLYAAGAASGHECYANEVGYASIIAFTYGVIAAETAVADLSA